MLETCRHLFSLWNGNNVSYCHWKSNEHLMDGLTGETDLDVFVAQKDKELAESLLIQCRYIECKTQKGHRYPNVSEWIGFDPTTGKLIHVHLHHQIITGTKFCKEYVFPIEDIIISSRIQDECTGVYITNPNLEIIILYCRIALKAVRKKSISPDKNSKKEIAYLKERIVEGKVHSICQQLLGENGDELFEYIMKEEIGCDVWYRIYKIAANWLKPFRKYSVMRVFFQYHFFDFRNRFIIMANTRYDRCIINKKVFPGSCFSICFLGQDGSGKSTVTIELCKWLNWKLEAHRFYLGSGDHNNGFLKRFVSKTERISRDSSINETKKKSASIHSNDSMVKKKKNIRTFISSLLISMKYLNSAHRAYREILRADKYCKKGGISLFDRFPQVQFEGIYDGPKIAYSCKKRGLNYTIINKMAKKELWYLTEIQRYQPKLVFKLILSPEESIRRKPFEDIEAVTRKHEITNQLCFDQSIVHIVDATQDYQEELVLIKNKIWEYICQNQL